MPKDSAAVNSSDAQPSRKGPRPLGLYTALLHNMSMLRTLVEHLPDATKPTLAADDMELFFAGVAKYQAMTHPQHPQNDPIAAQFGRVQLIDCGAKQAGAAPILLVPSMINKAYIFDLLPDDSMVHHLRAAGYHVYYLNWQEPTDYPEYPLTVSTAITEAIMPAISWLTAQHGTKPHLHGYCMGGLLSVAAVALQPEAVRSLSVVAMPWDYGHTKTQQFAQSYPHFYELVFDSIDYIPVDLVQTQFWTLDPLAVIKRMQGFATVTDPAQLRRMTALEDWLADGISVETSVAREALETWSKHNKPARGEWAIDGQAITPAQLKNVPLAVAVTGNDTIVPEVSSRAFVAQNSHAQVIEVPAGHAGCMAGRKANSHFFQPLIGWLKEQDNG